MSRTTGRPVVRVPPPARPAAPALAGLPVPLGARGWRYGWLWSLVWLVYLLAPLDRAWRQEDPVRRVLAVTAVLAFGAGYVLTFTLTRSARLTGRPIKAYLPWSTTTAMTVLAALVVLSVGQIGMSTLVYVAVVAVFLLGTRWSAAIVLGTVALAVILPKLVPGWKPDPTLAFGIFVGSVAVFGVTQLVQRNAQLAAAREEIARLAVADERNRMARDLHDILGHSLTVVAVKAELAGRLVRLAPERAEAEIDEVQRLARQALTEVRTAVAGYREISLGTELASAAAALSAAGIAADLPDPAGIDLPNERAALFGWVIREGVTNVVRHSGATRCRVHLGPAEVEINDDGRGPAADRAGAGGTGPIGHGLVGLRERVAQAGGRLTIGRSASGGFLLRARVP